MQVSSGVPVSPIRHKHHSLGRPRSCRTEKRTRCFSALKLGVGAMDETGIRKPCSKSATNSPKRTISPEVRNWQVRRGFHLPTVEANLQILRSPRSDESTTDCLPSSASTPTTWGRSSVDERIAPAAYFNLNAPPDEFPAPPNSSSGYGSKAPSMGVRTPILSSSRKIVQIAAGAPDTQPQKSESLFSGIRAAFSRWLDNIRSKNPKATLSRRPPTEAAGKSKSNDDSRRTTLSQSYPTRDLTSRRAPNVPAPLKIAASSAGERTTQQKEVYGEVPREPEHCMDTMVMTGWSTLTTEEFEKLAKAVAAATTREAQIEAAEKQRREAAARTSVKLVACEQSWNLHPSGRTSEVTTVQDSVIESGFCKEQNIEEHSSIVDHLESSYSVVEPAFACNCIHKSTLLGQRFSGSDLQSTSGLYQSRSKCTQYESCMILCPVCQNGSEPVRELQASCCTENLERRLCTNVSQTGSGSDESGNDCKRLSRSRRGTLKHKSRSKKFDSSKRYSVAAPEVIQLDRKTSGSQLGLCMSRHRSLSRPTRSISCLPELVVWSDSNYNPADENSHSSTSENSCSRYLDCEFSILFRDIKLIECIGLGPRKSIYRGEWHGEVMVHLFGSLTRKERIRFWKDVMRLTMTRHENIALFMGACAEPPNFAIVTSACNGISLYKMLHVQHEKIPRRFPFQILRQVIHAMEYLHSRNRPIIIRHLTSRNIFLQPKVVLSLTDYASMECPYQTCVPISPDCVRYVAPELFRHHLFSKREFYKNVSKRINRPQNELFLSRPQQMRHPTSGRGYLEESLSESESPTHGPTHPEIREKRLSLSKPPSAEDKNVGSQTSLNQVAESLRPQQCPNNRPKKKRFTWNGTFYFRDSAFNETTDIYAFGTLIFELHARRYPFHNLDNASFIAEVCAGRRDEGSNWYCTRSVKNMMLSCWLPSPNHRPSVRQLTQDIIHKHIYYRRQHSDPTSTHRFSHDD